MLTINIQELSIVNLPTCDISKMNDCKSDVKIRRNHTACVKLITYLLKSIHGGDIWGAKQRDRTGRVILRGYNLTR